MAKWHFCALICANGHTMRGVLFSTDVTNFVLVADRFREWNEVGEADGIFKGVCGHCNKRGLRYDDVDTGCDDSGAANAWLAALGQKCRTDQLINN